MSGNLLLEDWIDSVPDNVGDQTHINHCKPGKGNAKLYIKRVENGAVAFCHHCGERGYASNRILEVGGSARAGTHSSRSTAYPVGVDCKPDETSGALSGGLRGNVTKNICVLPKDAVNRVARWGNNDAKVWILKYGIPAHVIDAAGVCWSDYISSIIFPKYLEGELVAYQTRRFPPDDGPKYLTRGDSNSPYDALQGPVKGDTCVLVEDYMSALKVSQIVSACQLGGTMIRDSQMRHLLKDYSRFIIMLDNDNWQVKMNQVKLARKLGVYSSKVDIISLDMDPKEHKLSELKALLENVI